MAIRLLDPQLEWLRSFREKHRRAPIVLHIGNIANNGYNNAKILTELGIECDVICRDYYHIMSCPEWEEADFSGAIESQLYPDWGKIELNGYRRPEWFAQGPELTCLEYLKCRRVGTPSDIKRFWEFLGAKAKSGTSLLLSQNWMGRKVRGVLRKMYRMIKTPNAAFHRRATELCHAFSRLFPERPSCLQGSDFSGYHFNYAHWHNLIQKYDVVIAYSTDGIIPLLANVRPYLAYEHGTIRHIPFTDDTQGRLCALSYRLASGTFVTNCDNMEAARRLRLPKYRFVPHPINVASAKVDAQAIRGQWRQQLQTDFVLFHPSRHHWTADRDSDGEKGNDLLIRGFAEFVSRVNPQAHAIFVDWGNSSQDSKALIKALGIQASVSWIEPQPNARMLGMIEASDCVADQFSLGTFGGITPKGLMLGKPTLLCFDEAVHLGCFESMPPVVNVRSVEGIFHGLTRLHRDADYVKILASDGRNWFINHHSNERVARTLVAGMQMAIEDWQQQISADRKACA